MTTDRSVDRHRTPPTSVRIPERMSRLMDLARGKTSRNKFILQAVAREIRRILGRDVEPWGE